MSSLPGPLAGAAVAFLAGAGVLALEITGARLFIPWFGSSILVWSNVIGVTLGAVAAGNFLGGRLAERWPRGGLLAALLFAAGLLAALVPFALPPLASRYLPPDLELSSAFALMGRVSLLVAILTLGPPLLLLGAATPFLVRGAVREGRVARSAGLVSGAATAGSLVGTFVPVHFLVPVVGSRRTCVLAGFALLLAGLVVLAATRRAPGPRAAAGRLLVLLATFGAAAFLGWRQAGLAAAPLRAGTGEILAEIESCYQYARVERDGRRVALRLNEGLDSYHSLLVEGETLTGGAYFDYYNLFPPLLRTQETRRILILGFAAGTIARQMLRLYGDRLPLAITGVELDPEVAALGPRFFDLQDDPRLAVVTDQDARFYLDHTAASFDLIVVDVYASQIYVPFQVCSREFFASALRRLAPHGALVANLGGFSHEDRPLSDIRDTAAAVFGEVGLLRVAGGRNFVLAAGRDGPPDPRFAAVDWPAELHAVVERLGEPGAWRHFTAEPRAAVLTDDRSAVELLADRDLLARSRLQLEGGERVRR